MLGNWSNGGKLAWGVKIFFLELQGSFTGPESGMLLRVALPDTKKDNWPNRMEEFPKSGSMSHIELESMTGRLPYSQTSIFGRFCMETTHPLYWKLNTEYCHPKLSDLGTATLHRRQAILTATRPWIIYKRRNTTKEIIYTDAAAFTRVAELVLFGRGGFMRMAHLQPSEE